MLATRLSALSSTSGIQQQRSSSANRCRRSLTVNAAKRAAQGGPDKRRLNDQGYIVDNGEKGNIFAVMPRQLYTSSPTADRAARQGIGGVQGLAVLAVLIGAVGIATLGVAGNTTDTLQSVAGQSQDSLAAIAARLSASL